MRERAKSLSMMREREREPRRGKTYLLLQFSQLKPAIAGGCRPRVGETEKKRVGEREKREKLTNVTYHHIQISYN